MAPIHTLDIKTSYVEVEELAALFCALWQSLRKVTLAIECQWDNELRGGGWCPWITGRDIREVVGPLRESLESIDGGVRGIGVLSGGRSRASGGV